MINQKLIFGKQNLVVGKLKLYRKKIEFGIFSYK